MYLKNYIRNVLAVLLFILPLISQGGIEPLLRDDLCGFNISDTLLIKDNHFPDLTSPLWGNPAWKNGFSVKDITNRIILRVDENYLTCQLNFYAQPKTYTVTVHVTYWDGNFGRRDFTQDLTVSYDPRSGKIHTDKTVFQFHGGERVWMQVVYTNLPSSMNVCLSSEMEIERYFVFNRNDSISYSLIRCDTTTTGQLQFTWPTVTGAEEYDLEWTHVSDIHVNDNYSISHGDPTKIYFTFFQNASRVTTKQNFVRLDNKYESGYICFRVRPIGRDTHNVNIHITGVWSPANPPNRYLNFYLVAVSSYPCKLLVSGHENDLNWQYTVNFAEEGKNKLVIDYFDGSYRNRQSVTRVSTDGNTIVGETIYDHLGRPAINVLPVPSGDSVIKYYRKFNRFDDTASYTYNNFDTGFCSVNHPGAMDNISGASNYYSVNNPDKNMWQAYLPDAGGYPFTQTEYTPDNTGRINRISGVGVDHKIGSGHETRYFYGIPWQFELDRLFGVESGCASHYKKNMTVDANGQASVSYLDMNGKAVATALAGDSPAGIDTVDGGGSVFPVRVELLGENDVTRTDHSITRSSSFTVAGTTSYLFDYKLINTAYKNLLCLGSNICYNCVYDLVISIKDECGQEMLPHGAYRLKIGGIDSNFVCDSIPPQTIISSDSFNVMLSLGSYTLSYSLEVNEQAVDFYTDQFLKNNRCLYNLQGFYSNIVIDSTKCNCDTVTSVDRCDIYKEILISDMSPGGQYFTDSIQSGNNVLDSLSLLNSDSKLHYYGNSSIKSYRDIPAYFTPVHDTAFVWIDGHKKTPNQLTPEEFVQFWNKSWSESLIEFHPEYCYYERCVSNLRSEEYDRNMLLTDSFSKACDSGFIKPLSGIPSSALLPRFSGCNGKLDPFYVSGDGVPYLNDFRKRLYNYMATDQTVLVPDTSIWKIAWKTATANVDTAYKIGCSTFSSMFSKDTIELFWQLYRAMYLSEKQKLQEQIFSTSCSIDTCIDNKNCHGAWASAKRRFPGFKGIFGIDLSNTTRSYYNSYVSTKKQQVLSQLKSECQSNCESYADYWMSELDSCLGYSLDSLRRDSIRQGLIEVCVKGCGDYMNPFGSITLPVDSHTVHGYNSFEDVLRKRLRNLYNEQLCSTYQISLPYDSNHNYFVDSCNDADPFKCLLKNLINTCLDYHCETFDSVIRNCSILNVPDSFAIEFMVAMNDILRQGKPSLMGRSEIISDYGTRRFRFVLDDSTRDKLWLKTDTVRKFNSFALKFVMKINNSLLRCAIKMHYESGDTVGFAFSNIDSFTNIHGDGHIGFFITAHIGGDSVIFHSINSACFEFGQCIVTDSVRKTCTLNKPLINDFFNYVYTSKTPGLTTDQFFNLLCFFISDTLKPEIDSQYVDSLFYAANVKCDRCLNCNSVTKAMNYFKTSFPWLDETNKKYYTWLTNFMNRRFGYNLTFMDYLGFLNKCNDSTKIDSSYTYRLCNEPMFLTVHLKDSCLEEVIKLAYYNAGLQFQLYIDSVRQAFRKAYLAKCMSNFQSLAVRFDDKEYHYTLYYYDQAGNLVKTVPPKGVVRINDSLVWKQIDNYRDALSHNLTPPTMIYTTHDLASIYKFNSFNSVIRQYSPDADSSHFWYDQFNRLVCSQNARQYNESPKQYTYSRYDKLGRITEVGELSSSTIPNWSILNNINFPLNWGLAFTQVTKTIYDTSAFILNGFSQENLRNRVASSCYYHVGRDLYSYASHYTYDIHGNVTSLLLENIDPSDTSQWFKRIDYDFDLISGKVNTVYYQKSKPDHMTHIYDYDADNRIITVKTSDDDVCWDNDAKYFYYKHGALARTEIGDLKVQGIDYAYTIQGWIKGVNSVVLQPLHDMGRDGNSTGLNRYVGRDAFGYVLGYFSTSSPDYQAISRPPSYLNFLADVSGSNLESNYTDLYNGNISYMSTSINKFHDRGQPIQAYAFRYDQLNRIKQALTNRYIDTINNLWRSGTPSLVAYNNSYSYDPNGNILSLYRQGADNRPNMDYMTYSYYSGNNRLNHINDTVNSTNYRWDIDNQSTNNYLYDPIGNLIRDNQDSMTVKWNVYGKIKSVLKDNGNNIYFAYDPTGNRLEKRLKDSLTSFYTRDAQGNIMAVYDENRVKIAFRPDTATSLNQARYLGVLYSAVSATPFLNQILRPCLKDTSNLNTIITDLSGSLFSSALPLILASVKDTAEFGEIIECYLKRNNIILDPGGTTLPRYNDYSSTLRVNEFDLYGSSRLGTLSPDKFISTCYYRPIFNPFNKRYGNYKLSFQVHSTDSAIVKHKRGLRQYELTNHLGNVLVTVTDRKLPVINRISGCFDHFNADVKTATDYYPFGMMMPNRSSDSIGIIHDSSAIVNPQVVFNDDFSGGISNWQTFGSMTKSWDQSNRLHVSSTDQSAYVYTDVNVNPGSYYTLNVTADAGTCSSLNVEVWEGSSIISVGGIPSPSGSVTVYFTPSTSNVEIRIIRNDPTGLKDYYLQNVSLDERNYYNATAYSEDFSLGTGSWYAVGSSSVNWNPGNQWMEFVSNNPGDYAATGIGVTPGTNYNVQMYLDCGGTGSTVIEVWDNGSVIATATPACPNGTMNFSFVPSSPNVEIHIVRNDPPGTTYTIVVDNVQVTYQAYNDINRFTDNFTSPSGLWSTNTNAYSYLDSPPRMRLRGSNTGDYVSTPFAFMPNKTYQIQTNMDCGLAGNVMVAVYNGGTPLVIVPATLPNGITVLTFTTPTPMTYDVRISRNDPSGFDEDLNVKSITISYFDTTYSLYNYRWAEWHTDSRYRFGQNTQEKDNEIYGEGNLSAAKFWEYDTRLGRRWNRDELSEPGISIYSCFRNNPILYNDPNGDIPWPFLLMGYVVSNRVTGTIGNLSSDYNTPRFWKNQWIKHGGLDMPAPNGTPIRAAAEGKVIYAGPASGFGYMIMIQHSDGYVTVYGHMRENTVKVKTGDKVLNGQVIAGVSNNGISRGASGGYHLHFEIWKDGKRIDPESIYDLNSFLHPDQPVNPDPIVLKTVIICSKSTPKNCIDPTNNNINDNKAEPADPSPTQNDGNEFKPNEKSSFNPWN